MILRVLFSAVFGAWLLAFSAGAMAVGDDHVARIDPVVRDGKLYIDADIEFEISAELRNAAQKGVPIYFTADLEITTQRWWWFDKVVADKQITWRIMYNALTRQWRVGSGELSLPESTLDDALTLVRHIRGWAVADIDDLDPEREYHGRLRLRLDTSRLARPFQFDAFNSTAWALATPWKNFTFSITAGERAPS